MRVWQVYNSRYERYCELSSGNDFKFFLDDVEVDHVITADDEEGFLLVYVRDASGKPIDRRDGTPITAHVPGAVRIYIAPRQHPTGASYA